MAHVVVIRERDRRADDYRLHSRHELLVDLVDDLGERARGQPHRAVDRHRDHDGVLDGVTRGVGHARRDFGRERARRRGALHGCREREAREHRSKAHAHPSRQ